MGCLIFLRIDMMDEVMDEEELQREKTNPEACVSPRQTPFDTCITLPPICEADWQENKCNIKGNEDVPSFPCEQVAR